MSVTGHRVDARLGVAVAGARCTSRISRLFGIGGGTAAPGRVVSRVDPRALEKLSARLADGVVVVAGTNGKTTTARMVAEILTASGRHVVHNRAGANLVSGIVSTLAAQAVRAGQPERAVGVLETDEAALPEVLERTTPTLVLLTNLFRDQLDRYGELDHILSSWRRALEALPATSTVVVNADDPALVALTRGLTARRVWYGISDSVYRLPDVPHAAEVIGCPRCGHAISYRAIFVGHLGDWTCGTCGASRPRLDVAGHAVELWSHDFQSFKVTDQVSTARIEVGLPGLYNTYNVVAALAATTELGVPRAVASRTLSRYRGAFGRSERLVHRGRNLMVMLVKNPVGCNEVLRTIMGVDREIVAPLLLCLNDHANDGRDVSWIWDVDYESMATAMTDVYCAGTRWADLCNRLYYAGVPPRRIHAVGPEVGAATDAFAAALPQGGSGFVLPTYSAMLAIRRHLTKSQHLKDFWDE